MSTLPVQNRTAVETGRVGRVAVPTNGRSAQEWQSQDLWSRSSWRLDLPAGVVDEFRGWLERAGRDVDADSFAWDPRLLPRLAVFGAELRDGLSFGDGVRWVRGLEALSADHAVWRLFYVALGCAIGEPLTQYGRMYEVRDRGVDYRDTALPVSMTRDATGFHTDSSARAVNPDFVGLLCERPSENGGDSQVSNALSIWRLLEIEDPDAATALRQDLVRDLVTPGAEKSLANLLENRFPVFAVGRGPAGVEFRYMRYWIERGQEKAGRPVTERTRRALDRLDELLADPRFMVQFRLEAGDVIFVNNTFLAHNRTAFVDRGEENARLLQRMWISA